MNIYILNTLVTGFNSINILKRHLELHGVIGLSKRDATDKISGYRYLKQYCRENDLNFVELQSYSISNPNDKEKLLNLDIDILIAAGWQRLIPSWLIDHCKICVIGSHGSFHGITGGRGRSPQNWALLLGKKEFYISIFKIDKGIDSGPIIDTKKFVFSKLDDIRTSYYKVSWLTSHMIINNIKNGRILSGNFVKQEGKTRYLPQRLPGDGKIDWSRTSDEIYDFVRALTKPYPGAFSFIGKNKINIWRGIPFEIQDYSDTLTHGEIALTYANGDFLVKTGSSFFLVENYTMEFEESEYPLKEGMVLLSCDFNKQITEIIHRHYNKYPQLTISDDIADLQ